MKVNSSNVILLFQEFVTLESSSQGSNQTTKDEL